MGLRRYAYSRCFCYSRIDQPGAGILYAEIDRKAARRARRSLDVTGHYARPDIFALSINRKKLPPAAFAD